MSYYNRYKDFKINGANKTIPLITVPKKSSDKYLVYKVGKSRLDKISQQIVSLQDYKSELDKHFLYYGR